MSVGKICRREIHVATLEESVRAVARRMRERNVGMVVVVDAANRPVGIVTDRDLALRVLPEALDPDATTIRRVTTFTLRTVDEDLPIERALGLMRSGGFRRLPVVAKDGSLAGILTLDDILDLLAEELGDVRGLLHVQQPAGPSAF